MAEQPGFFDQLIGSEVDERSIYDAQIAGNITQGGRLAQMAFGLGQMAGGGLGTAVAAARGKGQEAQDRLVASAAGIQVEELRSRRRARKEMSQITDDGSFSARRKMAEVRARIANEEGDSRGLALALSASQRLKEEEEQWNKLQAQTKEQEAGALEETIKTAYDASGKPYSGTQGVRTNAEGKPEAGLWTNVQGELVFKPYGEDFSRVDPTKDIDAEEPLDKRISRLLSKPDKTRIKGLASGAFVALHKTDRILDTLTDLFEQGGVESVIGTSGSVITTIDNLARNVNGIINAFAPTREGSIKDSENKKSWLAEAQRAGSELSDMIVLPPGIVATSAAAQQHKAAVMEMAYMAARLAEPSNRGLSDNDIKNALARISGNTSNPQVMMRRFLEMQLDAATELDYELSMLHGALGEDVSDEDIDQAVLGRGYGKYTEKRNELFEKYGVVGTDSGRVTFAPGKLIGVDVQPGEGTGIEPEGAPVNYEEMSDDDAAAALGL